MKFESRIVQGPSVEVSEFGHSLPLRECHQHLKTHPTIMKLSRICLFIVVLSGFSALRCEAAVYHSNGSVSNVQTLHDYYAHDGDTITLPSGRFTWTRRLTLTKGITLQGQTTTINAGTRAGTANDVTIILCDVPRVGNGIVLRTDLTAGKTARITGITFAPGALRTSLAWGISFAGTGNVPCRVRMDHCHINQIYAAKLVHTGGWVYGVADHNVIDIRGGSFPFYITHNKYGRATQNHGDGAWADYPWFGTDKFWFVETNTIKRVNATFPHALVDSDNGGRYVFRHNYIENAVPQGHGTEGGRLRGQRANEYYKNTFNVTLNWNGGGTRSGTELWHDNIFLGREPTGLGALANYRTTWVRNDPIWGISDGTSIWDRNDTTGNGTYVEGHAPFLFDSGRATAASTFFGTQATMTDSTKNWRPNQWTGYSLRATNPAVNLGGYIYSNTATQIKYSWTIPAGQREMTFAPGDPYKIHRVLTVMDGCGMGKGDQVIGITPINQFTGRPSWTHQATEPCYYWNNVYTPNGHVLDKRGSNITNFPPRENVEFFNLGGGIPPDTTPSQVRSRYVAARNGVDYTGTFIYPHPLVR
jgi:hypothetical protein